MPVGSERNRGRGRREVTRGQRHAVRRAALDAQQVGHEIAREIDQLGSHQGAAGRRLRQTWFRRTNRPRPSFSSRCASGPRHSDVEIAVQVEIRHPETPQRAPGGRRSSDFQRTCRWPAIDRARPRETTATRGGFPPSSSRSSAPSPLKSCSTPPRIAAHVQATQVRYRGMAEQLVQEDLRRLAFAQDNQVHIAVVVQIAGQHQDGPAVGASNARAVGDVGERAVAVVVPELVGARAADEEVEIAVVVGVQEQSVRRDAGVPRSRWPGSHR